MPLGKVAVLGTPRHAQFTDLRPHLCRNIVCRARLTIAKAGQTPLLQECYWISTDGRGLRDRPHAKCDSAINIRNTVPISLFRELNLANAYARTGGKCRLSLLDRSQVVPCECDTRDLGSPTGVSGPVNALLPAVIVAPSHV